jgi:hypothetical protein
LTYGNVNVLRPSLLLAYNYIYLLVLRKSRWESFRKISQNSVSKCSFPERRLDSHCCICWCWRNAHNFIWLLICFYVLSSFCLSWDAFTEHTHSQAFIEQNQKVHKELMKPKIIFQVKERFPVSRQCPRVFNSNLQL